MFIFVTFFMVLLQQLLFSIVFISKDNKIWPWKAIKILIFCSILNFGCCICVWEKINMDFYNWMLNIHESIPLRYGHWSSISSFMAVSWVSCVYGISGLSSSRPILLTLEYQLAKCNSEMLLVIMHSRCAGLVDVVVGESDTFFCQLVYHRGVNVVIPETHIRVPCSENNSFKGFKYKKVTTTTTITTTTNRTNQQTKTLK